MRLHTDHRRAGASYHESTTHVIRVRHRVCVYARPFKAVYCHHSTATRLRYGLTPYVRASAMDRAPFKLSLMCKDKHDLCKGSALRDSRGFLLVADTKPTPTPTRFSGVGACRWAFYRHRQPFRVLVLPTRPMEPQVSLSVGTQPLPYACRPRLSSPTPSSLDNFRTRLWFISMKS